MPRIAFAESTDIPKTSRMGINEKIEKKIINVRIVVNNIVDSFSKWKITGFQRLVESQ
jgi:hypothetical protein